MPGAVLSLNEGDISARNRQFQQWHLVLKCIVGIDQCRGFSNEAKKLNFVKLLC